MTTPRDMISSSDAPAASDKLAGLLKKLDEAIGLLHDARDFAKPGKLPRVLDTARRVMLQEGGCQGVEQRASALEEAGVFLGSDWQTPNTSCPPSLPTP